MAEQSQRSRNRAPARSVILRTAAELFARKGYRATSMQEVAEELQIAKPTLYVHARSKLALLEGIMDELLAESERRLQEALAPDDGPEWIRALMKTWVEHSLEMAPHFQAYLTDRRELPPEVDDRYRRWSKSVDDRITAKIARQQSEGALNTELDPAIVAYAVIALTNWTSRWFTREGRWSVDDVVDGYWAMIQPGLDPRPSLDRAGSA